MGDRGRMLGMVAASLAHGFAQRCATPSIRAATGIFSRTSSPAASSEVIIRDGRKHRSVSGPW